MFTLRPLFAEFLGTAAIVTAVLGVGHMVQQLEAGSALGLLMIALAVGGVMFGAISALGPISGAHFNPAVSLVFLIKRELGLGSFFGYVLAQLLGALAGAALANAMYGKVLLPISSVERSGTGLWVGEVVATFGLVLFILLLAKNHSNLIAAAVGVWIVAGHLFTSSTSFANPAVSFGRVFSEAPTSISPSSLVGFVAMQLLGALLALLVVNLITNRKAVNG